MSASKSRFSGATICCKALSSAGGAYTLPMHPCRACEGHIFELEWEDLETTVTCPCCHTQWLVGSYPDEDCSCLTLEGDYNLTRR